MTCRFCSQELGTRPIVDAGGDVGVVHRACFRRWDRAAEAFEMTTSFSAIALAGPTVLEARRAA